MNPEIRMEGRKVKTNICMEASWLGAMVEMVSPMVKFAGMKIKQTR